MARTVARSHRGTISADRDRPERTPAVPSPLVPVTAGHYLRVTTTAGPSHRVGTFVARPPARTGATSATGLKAHPHGAISEAGRTLVVTTSVSRTARGMTSVVPHRTAVGVGILARHLVAGSLRRRTVGVTVLPLGPATISVRHLRRGEDPTGNVVMSTGSTTVRPRSHRVADRSNAVTSAASPRPLTDVTGSFRGRPNSVGALKS